MAYVPQGERLSYIASQTRETNRAIITETPGASWRSKKYDELPPLPTRSGSKPKIRVRNLDTFSAARDLLCQDHQNHRHVAGMNMGSARVPGGAWLKGGLGQEEMLCSRSTLYATLTAEFYPLTGASCIWSPDVVVYKKEFDPLIEEPEDYSTVGERFVLGMITVPALFQPQCSPEMSHFVDPNDEILVENKLRLMLRVLGSQNQTHLVLGALGCGAFRNPPQIIAAVFKRILAEEEWNGYFKEIIFAVLDRPQGPNISAFQDILGDVLYE